MMRFNISNNEIDTLKKTLIKIFNYLNKSSRVAVISFHSVEDRIIKHFFKSVYDELVILVFL